MAYENHKYGILGGSRNVLAWIGVGETPDTAWADAKLHNSNANGELSRISAGLYEICKANGFTKKISDLPHNSAYNLARATSRETQFRSDDFPGDRDGIFATQSEYDAQ